MAKSPVHALSAQQLNARTAQRTAELAVASGQVIAARLALAATPRGATAAGHAEFARMVPEKTQAFAAAGAGAAQQLTALAFTASRAALREGEAASAAALRLARASGPADFAAVQQRYLLDWFGRSVAHAEALSNAAARLQSAMVAPLHRTATANAKRLK